MQRRFVTLDVFTTAPFAGNPLAVVLDAEGLTTPVMQQIAREFNLSETVFVLPPADPAARAALRIFTPANELPFAGHPTVGTAVLLARLDGAGPRRFVLEEKIGPVPCRASSSGTSERGGRASFEIPRLPVKEADLRIDTRMAAALGLKPGDVGLDHLPAERWSAGNAFSCVPLKGLDAMSRCAVDLSRFDFIFGRNTRAAAFLFCRETRSVGNTLHARMFAPAFGILEDPATGSAVAAFAGYLAAHGGYPDGEHVVRIEQGYEMGRPSVMELTMRIAGGTLTGASIAGDAVVVLEGTIDVQPQP
jgi:trans-2,3-dihydro-3-hydroxyanthranilate isomerase